MFDCQCPLPFLWMFLYLFHHLPLLYSSLWGALLPAPPFSSTREAPRILTSSSLLPRSCPCAVFTDFRLSSQCLSTVKWSSCDHCVPVGPTFCFCGNRSTFAVGSIPTLSLEVPFRGENTTRLLNLWHISELSFCSIAVQLGDNWLLLELSLSCPWDFLILPSTPTSSSNSLIHSTHCGSSVFSFENVLHQGVNGPRSELHISVLQPEYPQRSEHLTNQRNIRTYLDDLCPACEPCLWSQYYQISTHFARNYSTAIY